MLNSQELKQLSHYDVDKIAWTIASVCKTTYNPDLTVYAAAYVLHRSLENYQISVDSMDLYFQTANEHEKRSLFIQRALEGSWDGIRQLKYRYSIDEFKALLLFYNGSGNKGWNFPTPEGVCQLAARLIRPVPGMKILDIGTGIGSFIRESFEEEPGASYVGLELNTELAIIAEIRAEIMGGDIYIWQCNVFDDFVTNSDYSAVFANYPLGMRSINLGSLGEEYVRRLAVSSPEFAKLSSMDWVFNKKAIDCVNGNGKVVCIMANGSAWNTIDRKARRYFVENGLVECVIALPSKVFEGTGIGTMMIVFSPGNDKTMMVDATELCEKGRRMNIITTDNVEKIINACQTESEISRYVSIDEIAHTDFILSPATYLSETEIATEDGVRLDSIARITRGAQIQASALDAMASSVATDTQYLMLANIQNGIIDDDLPYLREVDTRWEKYFLRNNNLILSKNGAPFKLAVADVREGQRILANGNLYIMTVDETRADPYYIKAYLESEKGTAALKRITVGSTIPSIGVEQLKGLIIPLPPLEEQHRVADEYKACIQELKSLRRRTEKVTNRMSHIFDECKGEMNFGS